MTQYVQPEPARDDASGGVGLPALPAGFSTALADRLRTALWVFDIDHARVIWANPAALRVWRADSLNELSARDLRRDMSPAVAARPIIAGSNSNAGFKL